MWFKSFKELGLEFIPRLEARGYTVPTWIQSQAVVFFCKNPAQNVIATSPSGSGKTAASVLAVLVPMASGKAIVVAPTRAQSRKIENEFRKLKYDQDIKIIAATSREIPTNGVPKANQVHEYAEEIMRGPYNQVRLRLKSFVLKSVRQFYIDCEDENALYSLVSVSQSMIFVEKQETASNVGQRLTAGGHSVSYLHGSLTTEVRDSTKTMFESGRTNVLISTNVLARGIDVSNVNLVINYDLPKNHSSGMADFDAYIHRIECTGQFGRTGITVNFVHSQQSYQLLRSIQENYGQDQLHLPTGNPSEDLRDRMDRMEAFMKVALEL
ncbi:RNA helicase required for poly(A+) mRNA export [Podila epigama]|nr:RNA helicase required for poly(A+) mRNA export [Podila epigama]